jgi:hypothetical protein
MKLGVACIGLILLASCATRPTILDQAAALHYSRMREYAAIQDLDQRARMENLENYRYQQFLARTGAILEQSARMGMYEAQTEAARAQTAALAQPVSPVAYPSEAESRATTPVGPAPVGNPFYPGSPLNPDSR